MARVDGPLFSSEAHGTIGDGLTFSKRKTGQQVRFQKKQTDVFTDKRADVRALYRLILACWQNKTAAQKKVFNDLATQKNLHMTGWDYFVKLAAARPLVYLGIVAYWSLNVENAAIVKDISKNGNHGALKPTYPGDCPVYIASKNDKLFTALNFDGSNDYASKTNFNASQINTGSLSVWFKALPSQNVNAHFFEIGASSDRVGFFINTPENRIYFYPVKAGSAIGLLWKAFVVGDEDWHHVVGVWSSVGTKFYFDGALVYPWSGNAVLNLGSSVNFYLGNHVGGGPYCFGGLLDEAIVYNRVIPADEAKALYEMFK